MSATDFALAYAGPAALPITMQLALAAGAPLGRFTIGGRFPRRFPGRLPGLWRGLALVQVGVLAGMVLIALDHAGLIRTALPDWSIWPALGVTLLTTLANIATPSRPERLLWGPVTVLMSLCLIGVIAL